MTVLAQTAGKRPDIRRYAFLRIACLQCQRIPIGTSLVSDFEFAVLLRNRLLLFCSRVSRCLRSCFHSCRIIMETFLNAFGQFSEVNFRDSRFAFEHNAIRFDSAYLCVFVFLPINRFEVIGQCE